MKLSSLPSFIVTLAGAGVNLYESLGHPDRIYSASLIFVLTFAVIWLSLFSRSFALRAQDRAIRAEEQLRHFLLTGKLLDSRLTIGQIIARWPAYVDDKIIRPLDNPLVKNEAIAILKGNLAPGGAAIKLAAATPKLFQHEGPAVVFESLEDLEKRIDDPNLNVTPDSVMVLRNAGPMGAPGMPEAGALPIPKKLGAKGVTDMVRISDARMSGTAFGTVVLHISPEAAAGGPLAQVRDGDMIKLDAKNRRLDFKVSDAELAKRKAEWKPLPKPDRGYLKLYTQTVTQAEHGCDFDFLSGIKS